MGLDSLRYHLKKTRMMMQLLLIPMLLSSLLLAENTPESPSEKTTPEQQQKKNRLALLELLQAELQETRLPIVDLLHDTILSPDSDTELFPPDEDGSSPDDSYLQPGGGIIVDNGNGDISGDPDVETNPDFSYGYWAQSDFDFESHYGESLIVLLENIDVTTRHLEGLIQSPTYTQYVYHSDAVTGQVSQSTPETTTTTSIESGEVQLGFDFGNGTALFTSDSYLQINEQDGSLWRVENFEGAVSSSGFASTQMESTGEVTVESGLLEGIFLGKEAEHIAGDFELEGVDKTASGSFFGTR